MSPEVSTSVSIVIVTWNGKALLEKCLPSVVNSSYDNFEIILADNASTDDTVAWVQTQFPSVKVVQHPENWAFCKGNNAAIPHTKGDYVLLLNNDVEVTQHWLQPLVAVLDNNPQVAAVQPKLLQYTERTRFEYAGGAGGFLDAYGYPFTRGRIFFSMEEDKGQYNDPAEVFWTTGAAMLIRKSALDKVGWLDEAFFMHMEEIDLCWRFKRAGYSIRVAPDSVVYHIGGASLPQGNARKTYFNFRNNLLMLYKNLPPEQWRRVFAMRILLDGLAMTRALFTGQLRELGAIFRAYKDAHHMSKEYSEERPASLNTHAQLPYKRSIVLDYFFSRKKTV